MIDLMITDSEAVPGTALCCTWYCTVCDAWCSTVAHKLAIAEPRENTFSLPTPIINESLHFCNESPCTWLVLGDSVVSTMYEALEQNPNTSNNAAQKMAYRNYMLVKLGHMGAGNWWDLPNCIKHGICNEWPEPTWASTVAQQAQSVQNMTTILHPTMKQELCFVYYH